MFLRLVTNARIFERPEPVARAWRQVEAWLDSPVAWVPQPTAGHREVLGTLLVSHGAHANLVADAHLAALAIEHGLLLCSSDSDFRPVPEPALGQSAERAGSARLRPHWRIGRGRAARVAR